MENKYYTPDITEFHIGFEYEYKEGFLAGVVKTQEDYDKSEWTKQTFDYVSKLSYIERSLNGLNAKNGLCGIRVKYLDQEDIEEYLGYKFKFDNNKYTPYDEICYINGSIWDRGVGIKYNLRTHLMVVTRYHFQGEYAHNNSHQLFEGIVKNKSELLTIMKMIGVKH